MRLSKPTLRLTITALASDDPAPLEAGTDRRYDVSRDGRRFLLDRAPVRQQVPITVVINWRDRLARAQSR